MASVVFFCAGLPKPQGSKRYVGIWKGGRGIMIEDCQALPGWRNAVSWMAEKAMRDAGLAIMRGPVELEATFWFPKPKSTPKRVIYKSTKPDLSKLLRALEDAMSGIVFVDDAQICDLKVAKSFGAPAGVEVRVTPLAEEKK
jgi:crossover junction endodeoxyribonuclease RusA